MMNVEKALVQMRGVREELGRAPHAVLITDIAAYLRPLTAELLRLENVIDSGAPPKPPIDPLAVWRKWDHAKFKLEALDRREWRSLCVSPETAFQPQLIAALKSDGTPLLRLSTLMGFVHAYFSRWGEIKNQPSVEGLIKKTLDHKDIRGRGRVVACWRGSLFLFSAAGSVRLAENIVEGNTNPDIVRQRFFLQKDAQIMMRAVETAAEKIADRLRANASKATETVAYGQLLFLKDSLLDSSFDPTHFRGLLSTIILSELPIRFPAIQKVVVQWVHDDPRLGDPRQSTRAPNWRLVEPEARTRFLGWLAKETLEFFFNTIVPENDENRRRAIFWIAYARAGLIRDFNVVVAHQDEALIRRSRAKFIPSYARLENETNQTSAFLMVFQGYGREYVVAEFSETGNAAHVCQRSSFESEGVKLHNTVFRRKQIHNVARAELRILHGRHSWELSAARSLSNQLGIRL